MSYDLGHLSRDELETVRDEQTELLKRLDAEHKDDPADHLADEMLYCFQLLEEIDRQIEAL